MDYPASDASARLHNGKFTDGDPINNIPPSKDSAVYQNMIFDELINVIQAGGESPDATKNDQLIQAIQTITSETEGLKEADLGGLSVFGNSLTANGYQKLPGGLIIQWGETARINGNSAGGHIQLFPIAFPNACLRVYMTANNSPYTTDKDSIAQVTSRSLTQFVFGINDINGGRNPNSYDYLSIGY